MVDQFKHVIFSIVVVAFLTLLFVHSVQAAKGGNGGGNGGGKPGEEPPTTVGCSGEFPALAYLEVRRRKNGRVIGTDLVLTNAAADPDCRIVFFSSDYFDDLSFTNDGGTYRLAWNREESDSSIVMVADFTVSDLDGVRSINEVLPIQPKEVFRYQGPHSGTGVLGIDVQRNQLAFGFEEGSREAGWFDTIYHIGDVRACLAQGDFAPVGDSCIEPLANAHNPTEGSVLFPVISDDGTRVYYESGSLGGIDDPDREYLHHLSFVEGDTGFWSLPQIVLTDIDLGRTNGVYGAVRLPRFGMLNGRATLAYRLSDLNPVVSSVRFVALDGVVNGQCQPVSGTESCLALGTAESIENIWVPDTNSFPKFRWSSSQLMILRSGSISVWDPTTNSESVLLVSGNIIEFDPLE